MHIIKLNIIGEKSPLPESILFEYLDNYFWSLNRATQIINDEWHYEIVKNGLTVKLFCPEKDSYKDKKSTEYTIRYKQKIEKELNYTLEFEYIGIDPEYGEIQIPKISEFYILYPDKYSPLLDGTTLNPIPLYKIPYTYHDGKCYDDINWYKSNYERVEGLWFNGTVGERWCQNQLQNFNSSLVKQGMECCRKIEELTKTPTYYHLFNYRAWGKTKDENRKCPNCGGEWIIKGRTYKDFYAFKCDKCRIVSQLSSNC